MKNKKSLTTDHRNFGENFKNTFKALWLFALNFLKLIGSFGKIFLYAPILPLVILGREYLIEIQKQVKTLDYKKVWEDKKININPNLILYTLSFGFLLWITIYSVFGTPYGWYKLYHESKHLAEYHSSVVAYLENDKIGFNDEYSNEVFDWFNGYNVAYSNRDCNFMKYVSVGLNQWEENYISNIPIDKKYTESFVKRDDYKCPSYDDINMKSYLNPIDVDFESKIINDDYNTIIATGFLTHSKILNDNFVGLSKRRFTLWKLAHWDTWRIHSIEPLD